MIEENSLSERSETSDRQHAQQQLQACVEHAQDLIRAARRTLEQDDDLPHLAYHLATLALEEIGKAALLGMLFIARTRNADTSWIESRLEDHVAKLTFAIWMPFIGGKVIEPRDLDDARETARSIHNRRMRGLYVSPRIGDTTDTTALPRQAVSKKQAEALIRVTEARLGIEQLRNFERLGESDEDLQWFFDIASEDDGVQRIFNKESIQKLAEMGSDVRRWVHWMRARIEADDAEHKTLAEREMQRTTGTEGEFRPKWEIRVRVYSAAHSVRPKVLAKWNRGFGERIRLSALDGRKDQFLADIILPDSVLAREVWTGSWNVARGFLMSLSIANLGFFWWSPPTWTSRFYESMTDLDTPKNIGLIIEGEPQLVSPWANRRGLRVLDDPGLSRTVACFNMIMHSRLNGTEQTLGSYLGGLTHLAKTDIHFPLQGAACSHFADALLIALRASGQWDGTSASREPAVSEFLSERFPNHEAELLDLFNKARNHQDDGNERPKFSITDAINLKTLCDLLLNEIAQKLFGNEVDHGREASRSESTKVRGKQGEERALGGSQRGE